MEPLGLSIANTGKALGGEAEPLSADTIYRMIGRGDLVAFKVGTRTLVSVESIKAFVARAPRLEVA